MTKDKEASMPIFFGLFQGIMPILGFYAGSLFEELITRYSGIVTLLVLGTIGINMIREGISKEEETRNKSILTYKILFFQAIATSIDAFAVGVSFCAIGVNVFSSAIIIAITTFLCSIVAIIIGRKFGDVLGEKAHILGGVILIIIGIKSIL
ncbi:manganese efflux pump MntP family protein [Clostridium sp. MSJ-8]|uniref:manganese efflux pump MntP n=1 Tax=Clostridium sp. MSJ-8 TaxID=2841510 RepID=UPI001C0EC8D9|nr:manganese efflux pump MntP family protein [Clostridium sp. MSJ-8]MBU5487917.1 manganese efflux pump MntP family protein [Clostridium sp. MSJ-8]